jgi:hypothetical protein
MVVHAAIARDEPLDALGLAEPDRWRYVLAPGLRS